MRGQIGFSSTTALPPAEAPRVNADLATLKRIYSAGPDEVREFVGEGPVLTDDKPVIEYFLSLPKNDGLGHYTGREGVFEKILTP